MSLPTDARPQAHFTFQLTHPSFSRDGTLSKPGCLEKEYDKIVSKMQCKKCSFTAHYATVNFYKHEGGEVYCLIKHQELGYLGISNRMWPKQNSISLTPTNFLLLVFPISVLALSSTQLNKCLGVSLTPHIYSISRLRLTLYSKHIPNLAFLFLLISSSKPA